MPRESLEAKIARTKKIFAALHATYPTAHCELNFSNPLELLVATILSAQCTDKRVNIVTESLFKKYRSAADFARADLAELEQEIKTTGFYRNKAKGIKAAAQSIVEEHGGKVPQTMEELVELGGVGRKTANVVLNTAFGEATIAVDTHIFRVANRTGLAPGATVRAVEDKLLKFVPDEFKQDAHHWLILHGRYVCKARKPDCPQCVIRDLCEYRHKTPAP